MSTPAAQSRLLILAFGPGTRPEGELAGALERMALRDRAVLRDALCVAREPHPGKLQAIDLALARRGGGLADLVDFRLAPDRREALTARTLTARPGGVGPGVIRAIGEELHPGAAVVAVLLAAGADAAELLEAAARCGGRPIADKRLGDHDLAGLGERLVGLAAQSTMRGSPP